MKKSRTSRLNILVFLLFLGVLLAGVYIAVAPRPFGMDLNQNRLMDWISSLGPWGGLGIIILMIAHNLIPFPAEIIAFISGEFFGLFWGTVYSWIGAMLGAVLAFSLARYLGRSAIEAFLPKHYENKLVNWSATNSADALLLARFIPAIAFNLINYLAGLTHIGWWTFIWTTGVGILPLTILFVYLGERMRDASWLEWLAMAIAALLVWAGAHMVIKLTRRN